MSNYLRVRLDDWLKNAEELTKYSNPMAPKYMASVVFGIPVNEVVLKRDILILSERRLRKLQNLLGRLLSGRPLAQVLGFTEFFNIRLKINKNVLTPRAETEQIAEYCVQNLPLSSTLIDVGCGSGAIGLSVVKARDDIFAYLVDKSRDALKISKINARFNNLLDHSPFRRIKFVQSNILSEIRFDSLNKKNTYYVANLPYLSPDWKEVDHIPLKFEPMNALYASENGMGIINRFIDQLTGNQLLNDSNWALLEHDPRQILDIKKKCDSVNLKSRKLSDYCTLIKI